MVRVSDIPSFGIDEVLGLDASWVKEAAIDAIGSEPNTFAGAIRVEPADDYGLLTLEMSLCFTYTTDCHRCGEPTAQSIEHGCDLRFSKADSPGSPSVQVEEIQLGEDDLDVGWYRDGNLSLADALSEAVALALPMRSTCQDAPGCDARTAKLLERASEQAGGHPGFSRLKNWT